MVFISQDGTSGSRLTNDVVSIMAQMPDAIEGVSGINLRSALAKIVAKGGGIGTEGGAEEEAKA